MKKEDLGQPVKTNELNKSYFGTTLSSKATRYEKMEADTRGNLQLVSTGSISIKSKNLKNSTSTISVTSKNVVKSVTLSTKIPQKLKHIELSISNAHSISNLIDDWDDNGALKVPINVYNSAILFLKKYALFILNDLGTVISAPEINPVKDASVDLEWHTPQARMLINVKNDGKIAYYGDSYNDLNSIKGKVDDQSVQTFLAVWMTKLTI